MPSSGCSTGLWGSRAATVHFGSANLGGLHDRRATAHRGAAGHMAASKEAQSKRDSVDHDGDTERSSSAIAHSRELNDRV